MRIAFDCQIFAAQPYGGISRYFVRLVEQLIAREQDAGVFVPWHINRYLDLLPPDIVRGVRLDRYPPRTARMLMSLDQMLAKRRIQCWKPEIVHETYYSRRSSAPRGCPTVITVYDMIHELFPGYFSPRDKTTVMKRAAVERADHVICISESTRRDLLASFDVPEEKVSVVYLGFERFLGEHQADESDSLSARPYLLYVGSRSGYKNFSGFLRAVARSSRLLRDIDVVAFGGGDFREEEVLLMDELGFGTGQVRYAGGDDHVLGKLYDGAAAFIYPSLYEGFGLPPLEAMAHRCPVISSNSSSMPEVIGDAGEFFDPASSDDMAAAIERVVYSPQRIDDLVSRGQARLEMFTWEHCADATMDIYRSLGGK